MEIIAYLANIAKPLDKRMEGVEYCKNVLNDPNSNENFPAQMLIVCDQLINQQDQLIVTNPNHLLSDLCILQINVKIYGIT